MLDVDDFDAEPQPLLPAWLSAYLLKAEKPLLFMFFLGSFMSCYGFVVSMEYALPDDFVAIAQNALTGTAQFVGQQSIFELVKAAIFFPATTVGSVRYVRAFAILVMALLAYILQRSLWGAGWSRFEAIFVTLIVFSTPPFQVYASYAATAPALLSASIAAAAAAILKRSEGERFAAFLRRSWRRFLCATLLLLIALSIYPPAAMFFCVVAAVFVFKPGAGVIEAKRQAHCFGSVYLVSALLAAGANFQEIAARANKVLSWEKLRWFVGEPLINALNVVAIDPSTWLGVLTGIVLAGGLLLYFEGDDLERLFNLMLALVILLLTAIPVLSAPENWSPYRTQSAVFALIVIYFFFAFTGYVQLLRRFTAVAPTPALLFLPMAVALYLASDSVWKNFALPQAKELLWMRGEIAARAMKKPPTIYIIGSTWRDSIGESMKYDEFGIPFSAAGYAFKSAIDVVVRETIRQKPGIVVEVVPAVGPQPPFGSAVVDMRGIRGLKYEPWLPQDPPVLGMNPVHSGELLQILSVSAVPGVFSNSRERAS